MTELATNPSADKALAGHIFRATWWDGDAVLCELCRLEADWKQAHETD